MIKKLANTIWVVLKAMWVFFVSITVVAGFNADGPKLYNDLNQYGLQKFATSLVESLIDFVQQTSMELIMAGALILCLFYQVIVLPASHEADRIDSNGDDTDHE